MIIHPACDLSRVGYHRDHYWVQFCFFFTSMITLYVMCQNLLKYVLFANDTCMTYKTLSTGSWLNFVCGNRVPLTLGKTNYMLYRSKLPDNELVLTINNVVLPRAK